jgi:hypothetical protein
MQLFNFVRCALLVAGFGIVFAGCGDDGTGPGSYQAVEQAKSQSEETLKTQGAKLERKKYPPGDAWAVDLSGKEINDETWAALQMLDRIAELNLSGTKFSDEHIELLNPLSGLLINLNLSKTEVTDAGLEKLEAIRLMELDVTQSKVTAQGAAEIARKRAADPKIVFKNLKVKS